MKRRKDISLRGALGLIATVLIMLLIQVPAQGACTADADCDGFPDTVDNSTFKLKDGATVSNPAMSSSKPDLFVILLPCTQNPDNKCSADQSILPATTPLGILSSAAQTLNLTVHQITNPDTQVFPPRYVTSSLTQKAVRIAENLSIAFSDVLGNSQQGTPNTTSDTATVYTKNIYTTVNNICGTKTCKDADNLALTKQAVIDKYIRHTIAHETGHMMNLATTCTPGTQGCNGGGCRTDIGCHYPTITKGTQTATIMDYSVYCTSGGSVTWYIGSKYNSADVNFKLVP